jgi:ABC-type glycerol-3-phosphate transport system substrate-binding protein
MRNMNRLFLSIGLMAGLAACSSTTGPAEKKHVLFWHVGSEEEAQILQRLAQEKFTSQTGIEVQCESMAWAEAHSKYLTAMAGDVTPDIGTMGLTWGTEFGSKGQMVDLRKTYPDDLGVLQAGTFPSIWEAVEYRGAVYSLPFDMTLQLMYYRKDLVPTAPATWDDLVATLKRLAPKKQGLLMDWGSMDWIGFAPFLWQAGGDYYNADKTSSNLDQPGSRNSVVLLRGPLSKIRCAQSRSGRGSGDEVGRFSLGDIGELVDQQPARGCAGIEREVVHCAVNGRSVRKKNRFYWGPGDGHL